MIPRAAAAPDGVRRVAHGDVAALVSDVDPEQATAAAVLRAHWRVLEQAATATTVLPVRFGTVMAGDNAVVDEFLAPEHDSLAAGLAELGRELEGRMTLRYVGPLPAYSFTGEEAAWA